MYKQVTRKTDKQIKQEAEQAGFDLSKYKLDNTQKFNAAYGEDREDLDFDDEESLAGGDQAKNVLDQTSNSLPEYQGVQDTYLGQSQKQAVQKELDHIYDAAIIESNKELQ